MKAYATADMYTVRESSKLPLNAHRSEAVV